MSYYGQAPRPKFWYRGNYIDVLPCLRWPCGIHTTLGQFGDWYRRQRAKEGGRIGERYDKTLPKIRKSQIRSWRRFRFEANRDLRRQGIITVFRAATLGNSVQFNRYGKPTVYATVDSRHG